MIICRKHDQLKNRVEVEIQAVLVRCGWLRSLKRLSELHTLSKHQEAPLYSMDDWQRLPRGAVESPPWRTSKASEHRAQDGPAGAGDGPDGPRGPCLLQPFCDALIRQKRLMHIKTSLLPYIFMHIYT